MGAPYVGLNVAALDSDNNGILNAIDEAAMITAKTNYVRRFDTDFDGNVDEFDDTYFDNTRANNPNLDTIRNNIKIGTYQKLEIPNLSCYLAALNPADAIMQTFNGGWELGVAETYGWIHIYRHPYISGEYGSEYVCRSFAKDTAIAAYKTLGYGCLLPAWSSEHAYNMFWIGGDWHDLHNWYILEPQVGNHFSAADETLDTAYQTEYIWFPKRTHVTAQVTYLEQFRLGVNWAEKTVNYIVGSYNDWDFNEETIPVPYTFITDLGVVPPSIENQLALILDKVVIVYYFDNATKIWSWYNPAWPSTENTLKSLVAGLPYWINVSANCTINGINLYTGWNLIGWC